MNTYKAVIEELGGKVGKTEYWGLKSTAYKIKKNRRAHYAFFNIDAPHAAVAEMERQMQISTDILRFLTVLEELDEKPSSRCASRTTVSVSAATVTAAGSRRPGRQRRSRRTSPAA